MLIGALALSMAAIYAQITVNDLVIARYTADAFRGRVYAVRYFLTFLVSGAAVSVIALLHGRGGFGLVLGITAVVALGFVIETALIAVLVHGVDDPVVPIEQGRSVARVLGRAGLDVTLVEVAAGHDLEILLQTVRDEPLW